MPVMWRTVLAGCAATLTAVALTGCGSDTPESTASPATASSSASPSASPAASLQVSTDMPMVSREEFADAFVSSYQMIFENAEKTEKAVYTDSYLSEDAAPVAGPNASPAPQGSSGTGQVEIFERELRNPDGTYRMESGKRQGGTSTITVGICQAPEECFSSTDDSEFTLDPQVQTLASLDPVEAARASVESFQGEDVQYRADPATGRFEVSSQATQTIAQYVFTGTKMMQFSAAGPGWRTMGQMKVVTPLNAKEPMPAADAIQ